MKHQRPHYRVIKVRLSKPQRSKNGRVFRKKPHYRKVGGDHTVKNRHNRIPISRERNTENFISDANRLDYIGTELSRLMLPPRALSETEKKLQNELFKEKRMIEDKWKNQSIETPFNNSAGKLEWKRSHEVRKYPSVILEDTSWISYLESKGVKVGKEADGQVEVIWPSRKIKEDITNPFSYFWNTEMAKSHKPKSPEQIREYYQRWRYGGSARKRSALRFSGEGANDYWKGKARNRLKDYGVTDGKVEIGKWNYGSSTYPEAPITVKLPNKKKLRGSILQAGNSANIDFENEEDLL